MSLRKSYMLHHMIFITSVKEVMFCQSFFVCLSVCVLAR